MNLRKTALICWAVVAGAVCTSTGQSELQFTRCLLSTNSELLLTLSAPAGAVCRIETSSNLVDWQALLTVASLGANQHTDSAAPFLPLRYYAARRVAETNALTGDHIQSDDGDIVIHPVNHASVVIAWKDRVVSIDPVNSAYYKALPKANLVLITHGHSDHLDAAAITENIATNGVIGAPVAVYNNLTASLKKTACVLTNGTRTNLADILVEAVPAYNTNSSPFHPRGTGNGYVLELGRRRIYVSGDTHTTPEMCALQNIDVAFLAMNQPYTMTIAMAVNAVRQFRPRIVYPYHYRPGSGYPSTDLASFKRQVLADPGIEVRLRRWY
ncbi:MAG: MBL fold metallo-hydrolase [Verrucomicrobiota bacterium]|nr:MBL fold metallo-hydrolase [Verrucomicrobiota bacterium]